MSTTDPVRVGPSTATQPTSQLPAAAVVTPAVMGYAGPNAPLASTRRSARSSVDIFLRTWGLHLLLSGLAFAMALPFLWMLLASVKDPADIASDDWLPPAVVVKDAVGNPVLDSDGQPVTERAFRWSNYLTVFDKPTDDNPLAEGIDFGRYYWNSIFVSAWVTFLQVLTSAMAAFSFARLKWTGRDKVFLLYLSTMMLPGLVMMIPNYQIMINLGLVDTFAGLIIPAAFSAFGTFLLRQFMLTIPSSLDEAAEIDGAGKLRLFWDIILPLSRPGLITLTIFTFMGNYHSFFWPLVMLRTDAKYTLPIGMMYFESTRGSSTHLLMAAVTMSVIPMVLLFVFLQKYLVKGIQLGAVKG